MTALHRWTRRAALVLCCAAPACAAQTATPVASLPAELFFKPAEVLEARLSPSGSRVAISSTIGATRVGLYVWDLEPGGQLRRTASFSDVDVSRKWQLISRVRTGVDPKLMAQVDLHRIRARDGLEIPVWVTAPPGRKAGAPGPAVVLVHGGPWVRDGFWRWASLDQFLASRGYVVIRPEFRGSTGYGRRHYGAGWKQWGQAMQDDVADAARWAVQQGWADRLCIAGASYGGYSTLMGLVRDGDLYRCGAAWVAVADPFLFLQGSWWTRDDISDEGRSHDLPTLVGDASKDEEMLKAASPVLQAARIRKPLLLAYGELDRHVPIEHGERLRKAMRAAGQEPLWIAYPDEGHSWLKLETRVDFARKLEAFLAEHLKNP